MIRHLVLMRFKPETTQARRTELEQAFAALKNALPLVQDLEWGTNVSPEGLDQGYTHCFSLTFANAADRDAYLPHPVHQSFVEQVKPWLDQVLVFDYVI